MSILSPNQHVLYREIHQREPQKLPAWSSTPGSIFAKSNGFGFDRSSSNEWKGRAKRDLRAHSFWPELFKPETLEMEPIQDCEQFDQILEQAKLASKPIVVDWMAAWCRKCIYLKPKLEKLAADYENKVKFYCVDVNKVPQPLVKRGNISKMPTIQIRARDSWKRTNKISSGVGDHDSRFYASAMFKNLSYYFTLPQFVFTRSYCNFQFSFVYIVRTILFCLIMRNKLDWHILYYETCCSMIA